MLVEMKEGRERPFVGPSVRLRVHQVLHVHPPAPHHGMARQQVAFVDLLQFEHGKQMHVLFVEEDRVVVDARFAQQLRELGPDLVMAPFVLSGGAGLQLHAECVVHLPVSVITTLNAAGLMALGLLTLLCASMSAARCAARPAVSAGSAARSASITSPASA